MCPSPSSASVMRENSLLKSFWCNGVEEYKQSGTLLGALQTLPGGWKGGLAAAARGLSGAALGSSGFFQLLLKAPSRRIQFLRVRPFLSPAHRVNS